jgi:hypothetical protein
MSRVLGSHALEVAVNSRGCKNPFCAQAAKR